MQKILSLSEAARAVPPLDGRTPHLASIWRWCRRGLRRGGVLIKLDYVRVGRRIGIPPEALNKFFRELAEADKTIPSASTHFEVRPLPIATAAKKRTGAQRQHDIERARKDLAAAGLQLADAPHCEGSR